MSGSVFDFVLDAVKIQSHARNIGDTISTIKSGSNESETTGPRPSRVELFHKRFNNPSRLPIVIMSFGGSDVTGQTSSDFRIKLLVVHPDGRRQKFLVTFPERKSLKIDQRYIGIPLTLKVDFIPGAIICKPGTGHTMTVGGKAATEHSLAVNDTVNLDQYAIEFLELPEPLPMEEATRFVSINSLTDMSESTVVVAAPVEQNEPAMERTPTPTPVAPPRIEAAAPKVRTPDPEDSTAIIRKLQVPGAPPGGNPYANLQPSMPTRVPVAPPSAAPNLDATDATMTEFVKPAVDRKQIMIAAGAFVLVAGFLFTRHGSEDASHDVGEKTPQQTETIGTAEPANSQSTQMKPMQVGTAEPEPAKPAEVPVVPPPAPEPIAAIPVPQNVGSEVPMGGKTNPMESPFDDKSGFDIMAVDAFFDAIDSGNEAKIKSLVEKRVVDVNLSRRKGYAALHVAAARGDLSIVKLLLKYKADPNVIDQSGATPLMWAVFRRHKPVAEFLATKTDLKIERQGGETAYAMARRLELAPYYRFLDPNPKTAAKKKAGSQRVPSALPEKKKKK